MITITFNPQTPQQAAVVASAIGAYMSASADATTLNEQQAKDLADAATNRADDAAREALQAERAAKKPRAPAAKSAEATAASSAASGAGATTATATPASPTDEGNAAAVSSEPAATAASPASSTAPAVSLEQVRAKLAALSQGGKAAEVKSLIGEFGVAKLTEIPSEKYGELLAKAEALA